MGIDKTNLTTQISNRIEGANSSCTTQDMLSLAAATNVVTDRKSSIALACDLPDLALGGIPEGTVYYVEELAVPVVASDTSWLGLDGRLYRKDVTNYEIYSIGSNSSGEHGVGTTSCSISPVREYTSTGNWSCIQAGGRRVMGIKSDGTLWGWGTNTSGQLGKNDAINYSSPVQEISSSTSWCNIDISSVYGTAIKTDGTLWTWGDNTCGRLGDGTLTSRSSPVQEFCSDTNWCASSSGGSHVAAIKTDGTMWAWGNGNLARLGINLNSGCRCTPVAVLGGYTDWLSVNATSDHTNGLRSNGEIWSWGTYSCGGLANGLNSGVASIPLQEFCSSTDWSTLIHSKLPNFGGSIKTDGTLWVWGNSGLARVFDPGPERFCSPIQERTSSTNWTFASAAQTGNSNCKTGIGIKADGTYWASGNLCNDGPYNFIPGAPNDTSYWYQNCQVQEYTSATDWVCAYVGTSRFSIAIKAV